MKSYPPDYPKTKELYNDNPFAYQAEAQLLDIVIDQGRVALILDQTLFYSKCGFHDQGIITNVGQACFRVTTIIKEENLIYHFGDWEQGPFIPKQSVILKVDQELRLANNHEHIGRHLLSYFLNIFLDDISIQ